MLGKVLLVTLERMGEGYLDCRKNNTRIRNNKELEHPGGSVS